MDRHVEQLASTHYEVKWARVDVTDIPFVVAKLAIRVLPCVVAFRDGVVVERIVGFEGVDDKKNSNNGDGVSTAMLEKRLLAKGVLSRVKFSSSSESSVARSDDEEDEDADDDIHPRRTIRSARAKMRPVDDDDDDDWD